jgi:hypothetical protein
MEYVGSAVAAGFVDSVGCQKIEPGLHKAVSEGRMLTACRTDRIHQFKIQYAQRVLD